MCGLHESADGCEGALVEHPVELPKVFVFVDAAHIAHWPCTVRNGEAV